jgi:hypothetical protein
MSDNCQLLLQAVGETFIREKMDGGDMIKKSVVTVMCLLLIFSLAGCSKAPSDKVIKSAIEGLLLKQLPLSWGGSLLGSRNTNIELVEIKEKGKFHDKEKYLLVKARVKGSCEANMILKWEAHPFDKIGEFKIHQDDYGKWLAETVNEDATF